jgi:YVTN family beta-propeller protein
MDDPPVGLAFTPDGKHAYVTTVVGVSVIDTATNTIEAARQVDLGAEMASGRGIAITPDGQTAYLTNAGLNTVSVIDTITTAVRTTIEVGVDPIDVAVAPHGLCAYVINEGSGSVSVIDTATNTVSTTVDVGKTPRGVAITADGRRVYVTNPGASSQGGPFDGLADTVSVIDTASNTVVAEVAVGATPNAIAIA